MKVVCYPTRNVTLQELISNEGKVLKNATTAYSNGGSLEIVVQKRETFSSFKRRNKGEKSFNQSITKLHLVDRFKGPYVGCMTRLIYVNLRSPS